MFNQFPISVINIDNGGWCIFSIFYPPSVVKTVTIRCYELRKYKILLLSINLENHRSKDAVAKIQAQHNLKRGVITNPLLREETDYRTQAGDLLIVLAQYERTVDDAVKRIERSENF